MPECLRRGPRFEVHRLFTEETVGFPTIITFTDLSGELVTTGGEYFGVRQLARNTDVAPDIEDYLPPNMNLSQDGRVSDGWTFTIAQVNT
jgi:hypothetical protein